MQTDTTRTAHGARWRAWHGHLVGALTVALLLADVAALTGTPVRVRAQTPPSASDPDRPWAAEADQLFAAGEMDRALKAYEQLTLVHPDDAGLWLRIAMIHLTEERAGAGLEAAQTAFSLSPDADAYLVLAQCQVAAGQGAKGAATLEKGVEKFPEDVALLESLATVSLARQEWAKAGGLLRQLLRLDPANAGYHLDLARILLAANEPADAEAQLNQFLQGEPHSPVGKALLGRAALMGGRVDEARLHFQESLAESENSEAYAGLGTVAFVGGDPGAAVEYFQKARDLQPEDADLNFNLGNALAQTGRMGDAIASYRRSLELDPRAASTHANLGVLLLNLLQVNEAREHLEQAVKIDPSLPEPYLHLARIAAATFDYDRAIAHYRDYVARIDDPKEKDRIGQVIENLQAKSEASRQAKARGEIHLLQLRVSSRPTAEEIIGRVQQGEDFYTLAQQNSELADVTGVDAGFVDPGSLGETFRGPIQALAVGTMTPVLDTATGYYVFMRVE